jgi:hypothetical protein
MASNDDITWLAANFMKEFAAFECLDSAIQIGDAIICKKEFLASLPQYKAMNKYHNVNGTLRMCEVLYEESSPQLLKLIHHNWSVVLNRDKDAAQQCGSGKYSSRLAFSRLPDEEEASLGVKDKPSNSFHLEISWR